MPTVLDSLCEVQLSTTTPADDLLREKLQQQALQEIEKTEKNRAELLKKPGNMLIGNLAVGKDFPMRVLAEIVDAALMDKETIQQTAKHFVAVGADIIDVGMVAGESQPEKAKCIVEWVKQVVDVPVSIDTLDPAEIKAAVQAGAELVLKRRCRKHRRNRPLRLKSLRLLLFQLTSAKATSPKKPKTASNTLKK